jgi:hypothetical protein
MGYEPSRGACAETNYQERVVAEAVPKFGATIIARELTIGVSKRKVVDIILLDY